LTEVSKKDKLFTEKELKEYVRHSKEYECLCRRVFDSEAELEKHQEKCSIYQNREIFEEIRKNPYLEEILIHKWLKDKRFKRREKPTFDENPSERNP